MNAKRGVAPCGHPGTHVTNNFITCDRRCEMAACVKCGSVNTIKWGPEFQRTGRTLWQCRAKNCETTFHIDACPRCNSTEVGPFVTFGGVAVHCVPCGTVWSSPDTLGS